MGEPGLRAKSAALVSYGTGMDEEGFFCDLTLQGIGGRGVSRTAHFVLSPAQCRDLGQALVALGSRTVRPRRSGAA